MAGAEPISTSRVTAVAIPRPDDAPARGPRGAPITLEIFCTLVQAPCYSVERSVRRLVDRNPDDVRVVYRNAYLPYRGNQAIAEAFVEAQAQGRFFELVDVVVGYNGRNGLLREADITSVAARAGLDLARLHRALADHRHLVRLEEDATRRELLGIGMMGVAWNGVVSSDASFAGLERSLARARALARERLAQGVPAEHLAETLWAEAVAARARELRGARRGADLPPRHRLDTRGLPVRGPADAPVTIVFINDPDSNYSRRQADVLDRLLEIYPDRVRVVSRTLQVTRQSPSEPEAMFWRALGVSSVPTIFVNGLKIVGVTDLHDLRVLVDAETSPGILGRLLGP